VPGSCPRRCPEPQSECGRASEHQGRGEGNRPPRPPLDGATPGQKADGDGRIVSRSKSGPGRSNSGAVMTAAGQDVRDAASTEHPMMRRPPPVQEVDASANMPTARSRSGSGEQQGRPASHRELGRALESPPFRGSVPVGVTITGVVDPIEASSVQCATGRGSERSRADRRAQGIRAPAQIGSPIATTTQRHQGDHIARADDCGREPEAGTLRLFDRLPATPLQRRRTEPPRR